MIDQEYIFKLLKKKKIETVSELAKVLGVNYHTLRYQLSRDSLRLDLAIKLAQFLGISVSSLLLSKTLVYLRLVEWRKKDYEYELFDYQNPSYLMFCILNSEDIKENT